MIICGIYKITNPKGKIYIGQSINIIDRKYKYNGLACKSQYKLFRSLVKYGIDAHKFEIIEECNKNDLNCRERYWQDFYNVLDRNKGLNLILTECNQNKKEVSEEHKKKMSKIGIKAQKHRYKKIYQYSLNGELVNIFDSVRDAEIKTGIRMFSIREAKRKRVPKLKGFLWSNEIKIFSDDVLNEAKLTFTDKMKIKMKFRNGKKVKQLTLGGDLLNTFSTIKEASIYTNIPASSIIANLKNKIKNPKQFKWEYIKK